MESNHSYKTAYGAAYARLLEQYQPKDIRLFEDLFINIFFNKTICSLMKNIIIRKWLTFMYNNPSAGLLGLQVCRTKFIDDTLKKGIDNGIEQLVILGAGLDTRPFRISGINKVKVFEVDLPIIQDKKKMIIKKRLGELPSNIIYTPIDFNIQTLDEVLSVKGLDVAKPIFFIWEGVTQYITQEAVENTLEFISKASSGSIVLFSYIIKSVIDGTSSILGADFLMNFFNMGDEKWSFGLNPSDISDFINRYNLKLIEDVGASYYQENYLKPIGRNLYVSEIERVIHAMII